MGNPYWVKTLINRTFSQRFFWAKLTHLPGIGKVIEQALFGGDDIIFLPKDRTIPINESIEKPEEQAAPSEVVAHFIRKAEYRWKMDFCICRDSTNCKDYPVELGCLFLGEAVQDINPQFGRLVSEDEALDHVQRCREAGLVHLIGRNKLDSVWLNVKPGEKLMTICNCCPCCCLWTMLPDIAPRIGTKINRMPGVSVSVSDRCTGCGTCTDEVCFVNAIHMEDDHAVISEGCRGCGRCADECPHNAIEVHVEDLDFVGNSIEKLTSLVDVT